MFIYLFIYLIFILCLLFLKFHWNISVLILIDRLLIIFFTSSLSNVLPRGIIGQTYPLTHISFQYISLTFLSYPLSTHQQLRFLLLLLAACGCPLAGPAPNPHPPRRVPKWVREGKSSTATGG